MAIYSRQAFSTVGPATKNPLSVEIFFSLLGIFYLTNKFEFDFSSSFVYVSAISSHLVLFFMYISK